MKKLLALTGLALLCIFNAQQMQAACNPSYVFDDSNCPQVTFNGFVFLPPGTNVISYSWDFGDGNTGSGQNVSHTYTSNGNYSVCFTVVTDEPCTSSFCDIVTVACLQGTDCTADFNYVTSSCPDIDFFDQSATTVGAITSWAWEFGDGNTGTAQNETNNYAQNGDYEACLTITTDSGCIATLCDTVAVTCLPPTDCAAGFVLNFSCPGANVFDTSTAVPGNVNSWSWDWGDGDTDIGQSPPSHMYTSNSNYDICLTIGTTNGCTDTHCETVTVNCLAGSFCDAAFVYDASACPDVEFTDSSTSMPGTIADWAWTFGDFGTSTQQNPAHTYTANQGYEVCLTITTSDACTDTYCDSVYIDCIVSCQSNFSFISTGCAAYDFTDLSTSAPGNIVDWDWDFDDGDTSDLQEPSHTFTANGTYSVCLTITTSDGCVSTLCKNITVTCIVGPSCNASFNYTLGLCPEIAFFDNSTSSPGSVVGWTWDFGDGGTSSDPDPTNTYGCNGSYTVCLEIATVDACIDQVCQVVNVTCVPQPSANFTYVASDLDVNFTNTSTGNDLTYEWDFGDTNNDTQASPSHSYAAPGTYDVCLVVTDSCAVTDTLCQQLVLTCGAPVASFNFTTSLLNADFTDGSVGTGIDSWNWTFGDGDTDTLQNTAHTYADTGSYTVCLTVSDICGSDDTCQTVQITCGPGPSANFTYSATGLQSDFTNISAGTGLTYNWDFGDASSSTDVDPSHTYANPGGYTVCLIVTDTCNFTDTLCQLVNVTCAIPVASFTYSDNFFDVNFTDASTGSNITTWGWTFGDGDTDTVPTPMHTYGSTGPFTACLTVTDLCGTDDTCQTINIVCPTPVASFGATTDNFDATFSDASTGNSIDSWGWTFGDGDTDTVPNPLHTYADTLPYTVCLTVTDICGTDDTCMVVDITCPAPVAHFSFLVDGLTVDFTDQSTTSSTITDWEWNYDDGNNDSGIQDPSHDYAVDGTYNVCLTVTDECGSDTYCEEVTVKVSGIGERQRSNAIDIYPNPSDGSFQLRLHTATNEQIEIFDARGKLVRTFMMNGETALSVTGLESGTYSVKIGTDAHVSKRVIVVR